MVKTYKSIHLETKDCQMIKQSDPLLMKIEFEKLTQAYELGIRSNLFKVPKIYDIISVNNLVES